MMDGKDEFGYDSFKKSLMLVFISILATYLNFRLYGMGMDL